MPSSVAAVSLPFDIYVDVMREAEERGVTLSKMISFYVVQGYALESRGFFAVPPPLFGKGTVIAPKPGQKLLPMTIHNPEGQRFDPVAPAEKAE